MLFDSNSRCDTEEPRVFLDEGFVTMVALCSWFPKPGVTRNSWEGAAAISPSAATCGFPEQPAEGVTGCV